MRKLRTLFAAIALVAILFGILIAVLVAGLISIPKLDEARTEDLTDRLLKENFLPLRSLGGELICVFPPDDHAAAAIRLNIGEYTSNRFFDLVEPNKWTIGVLFPKTMRMVVYSVNNDRIRLDGNERRCGQNLKVRLSPGVPPTAIVENVQIKNLGRLAD